MLYAACPEKGSFHSGGRGGGKGRGTRPRLSEFSGSAPGVQNIGPLLFLLYVNVLPNTSSLLTFHLFADDTNINFSSKNLSNLEATLNRELKSVAE